MSDYNNTNDVTPAEIAALDHRPVCGYCGKPLGEAACKSSLPDSPMFHSASCMMKWEAERSEKPTTITAGKLAEEWESKWKLLIGAGKVRIGGKGWEIENIKVTYVVVKYSDFNFVHPSTAEREYNIYWLKDTPPAETQGVDSGEAELMRLIKLGKKVDAIILHRKLYNSGLREAKDAVDAMTENRPTYAQLETENATLTRELGAARGEVIAQNKLITEAKYILHGLVVRNKSERMKVNDWLRKAAGGGVEWRVNGKT